MQHKNEQILNWLETADAGGLSLTLQELNHLLSCAPREAQKTREFAYIVDSSKTRIQPRMVS